MSDRNESSHWLVIPGVNPSLWSHRIETDEIIIGRAQECDITLAHVTVSRQHARIVRGRKIGYILEDLGSSNGTYLNSRPLPPSTPKQIDVGDFLSFGGVHTHVVSPSDMKSRTAEWSRRRTAQMDLAGDLGASDPSCETLNDGPLRVLQLMLRGYANKAIAAQLHISEDTVKSHVKTIYRHFKVHSSKELFALMLSKRLDWLEPGSQTVPLPVASG